MRAATAGDPYRTETQGVVTAAIDGGARRGGRGVRGRRDRRLPASSCTPPPPPRRRRRKSRHSAPSISSPWCCSSCWCSACCGRCCSRSRRSASRPAPPSPRASYAFGHVHILTLTFGTSLIGVSVDYSLHYFVNRMRDDADTTPHNIVPGAHPRLHDHRRRLPHVVSRADPGAAADRVVLGGGPGGRVRHASSSSIRAFRAARRSRAVPGWVARLADLRVENLLPRAPGGSIGAAGARAPRARACCACRRATTCARCSGRRPHSSPRRQRVRTLLGVGFDTRFVLVTAATPELVLQRLEALAPVLAQLVADGKIHGRVEPEPEPASRSSASSANRELLAAQVYGPEGALDARHAAARFRAGRHRRATCGLRGSRRRDAHARSAGSTSPLSAPVRHLWLGALGADHAAVVLLDGNTAPGGRARRGRNGARCAVRRPGCRHFAMCSANTGASRAG